MVGHPTIVALPLMFLTFDWSQENAPAPKRGITAGPRADHRHDPLSPSKTRTITTGVDVRTGRRLPAWRTRVEVVVEETPADGDIDEGTVWVVDDPPARSLARGIIVQYSANSITLGAGRLSKVTRLTRHWVSFKVHGVSPLTSLRVPMPWAQLSQVEQFEHVTNYAALPSFPPPSRTDSYAAASGGNDVTPYDFDIDPEDQYLEKKLRFRNTWHDYAGRRSIETARNWTASVPAAITACEASGSTTTQAPNGMSREG